MPQVLMIKLPTLLSYGWPHCWRRRPSTQWTTSSTSSWKYGPLICSQVRELRLARGRCLLMGLPSLIWKYPWIIFHDKAVDHNKRRLKSPLHDQRETSWLVPQQVHEATLARKQTLASENRPRPAPACGGRSPDWTRWGEKELKRSWRGEKCRFGIGKTV